MTLPLPKPIRLLPTEVPFVKISQTKRDQPLQDPDREEQLTTLLQMRAGLTFYFQLLRASTSFTPLHDYEWVRHIQHLESAEGAVLYDRVSSELHALKLAKQTNERAAETEMMLNRKASGVSQHVLTIHHHGATSASIYFGVAELVAAPLASRTAAAQGIEDDEEFWRLASQLTSGVADLHQTGILHLAIQVRNQQHGMHKFPDICCVTAW